jgi:hypothetical protein
MSRGIAIDGSDDIGAERGADLGIVLKRIGIDLPNQFAGHIRVVEASAYATDHGVLEPVVLQHGAIDEGREFRLVTHHFIRLATYAHPHGIDLVGRLDKPSVL